MESIVDREIMQEIEAEQAAQQTEAQPEAQTEAQTETLEDTAADERTEALSEEKPQEEGENQPEAAQDAERELPELEPMPDEPATEAQTQTARQDENAIPQVYLNLLGVQSQEDAVKRLTDIAVNNLIAQGTPEVVARELVQLRIQQNGQPHRVRDEPKAEETQPEPKQEQSAQQAEVTPRIQHLADQAQYILERTGVDMMAQVRKDASLMQGISAYNAGKGGFDMIGAYNKLREKSQRMSTRSKVPATTGMSGGQTGSPRMRVEDMTDEDIERIEQRVKRGERVIL